jgi:hypothetical protein
MAIGAFFIGKQEFALYTRPAADATLRPNQFGAIGPVVGEA